MDPAETERLKQALSSHGVLIGQHEATLVKVRDSLQQVSSSVCHLGLHDYYSGFETLLSQRATPDAASASILSVSGSTPFVSLVTSSLSVREPFILTPAHYSGDLGCCFQFLFQCSLVFSQQPSTYPTDATKISFLSSLLAGRAEVWELASSSTNQIIRSDCHTFSRDAKGF